mgnify:CR=1 FL=1|jgi:hypothetical protein
MKAGDLVKVHWGACDWSGTEGVDWGYSVGVVTGEIVWWENVHRLVSPCGDVEILFRGERVKYNLGRLEVISASR